MIAITPSLNASSRPLVIYTPTHVVVYQDNTGFSYQSDMSIMRQGRLAAIAK
jgi:hypothetical protein